MLTWCAESSRALTPCETSIVLSFRLGTYNLWPRISECGLRGQWHSTIERTKQENHIVCMNIVSACICYVINQSTVSALEQWCYWDTLFDFGQESWFLITRKIFMDTAQPLSVKNHMEESEQPLLFGTKAQRAIRNMRWPPMETVSSATLTVTIH